MNIKEALKEATIELKAASIFEPDASAEVLLADVLDISRTELLTHGEQVLAPGEYKKFQKYLKRRKDHEPVWQIIGKVDFWGMSYLVNKNVLVPRPETEILVQKVLAYVKKENRALNILDLGTGSGTVSIALKKELQNCSISASEVSGRALKVAKKNARRLLPKAEIKFKKGDLMSPWKGQKFDIIVANLPYIPHEDMSSLSLDVFHHEPRLALDGGKGGLEIYERFLKVAPNYLEHKGAIFCEIGIEQGIALKKLVSTYMPEASCEISGDLAGIDRIGIIKR
jgi:release factor glutamine methyltransferase